MASFLAWMLLIVRPGDVPDPTAIENLERPCGRGLMLMRHYMSEVSFAGRGNSADTISSLRRREPRPPAFPACGCDGVWAT